MFRNRNSTRKPDDEFISRFQQTFSEIVPRRDSDHGPDGGIPLMTGRYAEPELLNLGFGADMADVRSRPLEHDPQQMKLDEANVKFLNERTPRNLQDLNWSPSWMDTASMQLMSSFAGQHPGFYTPNSGGMGAVFHNQAGDLHTPTTGMNMITPLSLSNPLVGAHPSNTHMDQQFQQHYMATHLPDMNPYLQQASFAPSAFMNRNSFDAMDESGDNGSMHSMHSMPVDQASNATNATDYSNAMSMSYADADNFRYNVTLRAPTAMVKHRREIPISYLNKGQAYNLTVTDSTPPMATSETVKYRTFVRVSFDEEQQRLKPATCWQLWKEGRGLNEAHQRGGKLLAVEFADSVPGGDNKHRQIQLEQMSFDGFCVTWTANPDTGTSDCSIPVRFNFLSTDFSHSKGVKGIPVRLCAKTELLVPGEDAGVSREAEVSYCKVKLFRDHGAERKLSNDVAHVKKTIEKLKQQIAQAEVGGGFGKRKRGSAASTLKSMDRSKTSKHKRTWSMESQDGNSEKMSLEDDLQSKLAMMQDMFSSTRNVSVLALRGEEEDDPDLYPVRLPADSEIKTDGLNRQSFNASQSLESLILSPTSSNVSLNSPHMGSFKDLKKSGVVHKIKSEDAKVGYIEVVDVDPTYCPPAERPPQPIACFYVKFAGNNQNPDFYRAIYLTERTARDLTQKISEKHHIDPARIVRIVHVNKNGLRIMVDDDVVRELPEGQDMVADIYETPGPGGGFSGSPMEIKLTY
ncbi:hypothetical protein N7532_004629 [Penicillium argentinense]|uniref:Grh/CP2 DB domain-containing protein n=1 Tax=Penicillium argentinense TaxID=1131581 RepID=A0A9W9KF24_9EURO|nr:uncharacterized protein N7532_004629 [Penicillium argentinense]KAJ5104100.1 hypothetical protein N7532_004629 [Penicillium argentinense]